MSKLKVLITTNIPSPYFVDYANELIKYVDLTVSFELKKANDRDSSWNNIEQTFKFNFFYLNAIRFNKESGLSFRLKKHIKNSNYDRIIIANPLTPTGIVTIHWMNKHKIPFIIQSEGGFQKNGKGLKEYIKNQTLKNAKYYLTGMGNNKDYFLKYGATTNKLKKYNFTSLKNKDILKQPLTKVEKNKIKKQLNINYENVILYVGQFIKRKDIPTLLNASQYLKNDTCVILIGGEPTQQYINIINKLNLKNIIFIPFLVNDKLTMYYRASDIFVLPTKEDTWGLVINEAMANGLPIISTNKSIAANILIKNNINGFIVNSGDSRRINVLIKKLLLNKELCKKIACNNLQKIKDYTIENMAFTIFNHLKSD